MSENQFDVIVIGSGPAGYVCAIRCAQLGMKTACIEKNVDQAEKAQFGGTCLNVGCIPSKALLESSHKYEEAQQSLGEHGIKTQSVKLDLATMMQRKDSIVAKLVGGVGGLLKANGVTSIVGYGRLTGENTVEVENAGKKTSYNANNIVIASGSEPVAIADAAYNSQTIVDSTGALAFDAVPEKLCIIGAGVIGLELGSVWNRLGSEVTVLEAMPDFLPMVDADIGKMVLKDMRKQGLDIKLGSLVKKAETSGKKVTVSYSDAKGQEHSLQVNKVVVAVGRRPLTDDVFSSQLPIQKDNKGFIQVDDNCRTALPHVFAIGDIVRGPMLAHKGSEEGIMVAEIIAGKKTQVNYSAIPNVIYTSPEVAWVGKSSQECEKESIKVGKFPFAAIGRAMANNDTRGMVKIISDKDSDQVLGIHIYSQHAGELIAQAVTSLEFMASTEDIALTVFAHPTTSEAIHEAALEADGHAIHMANRKKS